MCSLHTRPCLLINAYPRFMTKKKPCQSRPKEHLETMQSISSQVPLWTTQLKMSLAKPLYSTMKLYEAHHLSAMSELCKRYLSSLLLSLNPIFPLLSHSLSFLLQPVWVLSVPVSLTDRFVTIHLWPNLWFCFQNKWSYCALYICVTVSERVSVNEPTECRFAKQRYVANTRLFERVIFSLMHLLNWLVVYIQSHIHCFIEFHIWIAHEDRDRVVIYEKG